MWGVVKRRPGQASWNRWCGQRRKSRRVPGSPRAEGLLGGWAWELGRGACSAVFRSLSFILRSVREPGVQSRQECCQLEGGGLDSCWKTDGHGRGLETPLWWVPFPTHPCSPRHHGQPRSLALLVTIKRLSKGKDLRDHPGPRRVGQRGDWAVEGGAD